MITSDELRQLLDYDPKTGIFTWRMSTGSRAVAGSKAGSRNGGRDGYIRIMVSKRVYLAHRLAWLHTHGEWPEDQIDHRNGARDDNRLSNLRLATNSQNGANKRRYANNRSGAKGVYWRGQRGKWTADIQVNGNRKNLGLFTTKEAAAEAYRQAAEAVFGEFACANR